VLRAPALRLRASQLIRSVLRPWVETTITSLDLLIQHAASWVHAERQAHRNGAALLLPDVRRRLGPYFRAALLDAVRIVLVPSIGNPPFYQELPPELPDPIDFRDMRGITFGDTILLAGSRGASANDASLVFHECVHAVQYSILGVEEFVRRYVTGWEEQGFAHCRIPLERHAYELQERFDAESSPGFLVDAEVRRALL
jgi:hypothetical protein